MLSYPNCEIVKMLTTYYMIIPLEALRLKVKLKFNNRDELLAAIIESIIDPDSGVIITDHYSLKIPTAMHLVNEADIDLVLNKLIKGITTKTNQGNESGPPRPMSV